MKIVLQGVRGERSARHRAAAPTITAGPAFPDLRRGEAHREGEIDDRPCPVNGLERVDDHLGASLRVDVGPRVPDDIDLRHAPRGVLSQIDVGGRRVAPRTVPLGDEASEELLVARVGGPEDR